MATIGHVSFTLPVRDCITMARDNEGSFESSYLLSR
jgi:hypothetical protein